MLARRPSTVVAFEIAASASSYRACPLLLKSALCKLMKISFPKAQAQASYEFTSGSPEFV